MYKSVVIKAFKKAKEEIPGRSNKTNMSNHISEVLLNEYRYQISGKTLRNLYDESKEIDVRSDISINSSHVIYLCKFLGYKDYDEFLRDNPEEDDRDGKNKLIVIIKRNKVALIISIITIIIIYSITTFNKQRWMVWDEHHYVEVNFDAEKYTLSQLKLYNADRIESFQKVNPDCETQYFNEDGSMNFWYGKNIKGELEYFTAIAKHPETGKTLKAITAYMVRTHICDTY